MLQLANTEVENAHWEDHVPLQVVFRFPLAMLVSWSANPSSSASHSSFGNSISYRL